MTLSLAIHSAAAPQRISTARRLATALLLALLLCLVAAVAEPTTASAAPRSQQYLVAADPAAAAVYVYRASDLKRTGQLDNVKLGTHVGTVQLPDGRLLMVDDAHATVLALRILRNGRPRVVGSAAIPTTRPWERAGWAAVDAKLRYLAVGSDNEGASSQTVTLVDLRTYATSQINVPLNANAAGAYAEMQVYLAGRPLQLVVTTGGRFETFPVAPIVAGHSPAAISSAPLGPNNHGPVVSRHGDQVFSTTADGLDGAALPGATLTAPRSVAYSTVRNVVQNYRPRLASDGHTVWGAVAEDTGLAADAWADTRNDANLINTATNRSTLVRLPDGITSRMALSRRYAAVATQHPDGDTVTLLDTRPSSATYRRVVGTIALSALTGGPVAGTPAAGSQGRFVAANATGSRVFVSNGGDGTLTAINTATRRVDRTTATPTPLTGGGYLTVVQAGTPITDLVAR